MTNIKKQIKKYLFLVSVVMLTGCGENVTYSYLMQHPQKLRKEIDRCQTSKVSMENPKYCEIVLFAAQNMFSILRQMQEDPEQFGERLLLAQMALFKAKAALDEAQQKLPAVKSEDAEQNISKLQKTYDELNDEINIKLAAIGINTPG